MAVPLFRVWEAVVINADLIAAGDQVGYFCFKSAARPAMCGLDMEVPLRKSKLRPASLGDMAARTSTPGAMMSGLSRSPPPASAGPREENEATSGATAPV